MPRLACDKLGHTSSKTPVDLLSEKCWSHRKLPSIRYGTPSKHHKLFAFYGVVPKGLLTFLGSLYKEVVKLLPELWSIASRDKPSEFFFSSFQK